MPLTDEQRRSFQAILEARGIWDNECPFCGQRAGWQVGDMVKDNIANQDLSVQMGRGRAMVQLVCNYCHYVAHFAME